MIGEAWLEERRGGIGGSDAPVVVGVSPWKTPYRLWLEKRGEVEPEPDSVRMAVGRQLEPLILRLYEQQTGRAVATPEGILRHEQYPWMLATLDGLAEDRIIEAKTAASDAGWGQPGSDQVPEHYYVQVQHYMAVTGQQLADVVVLIGHDDLRVYEVPSDPEFQDLLIEAEADFWAKVQAGEPPEPKSSSDCLQRWRTARAGQAITASAEVEEQVRRLRELRRQIETLEAEADRAKAAIMAAMGEAEILVDPAGTPLATWKTIKGAEQLDTQAIRREAPDIWARFTRQGKPTRRFLLK